MSWQAGQLWLRVKETAGAKKLVEKELNNALDATGPDMNEYGEDTDDEVGLP